MEVVNKELLDEASKEISEKEKKDKGLKTCLIVDDVSQQMYDQQLKLLSAH